MKKIVLIFTCMFLFILTGCTAESKIKNDYIKWIEGNEGINIDKDDLKIIKNYGRYDGAVVFLINRNSYEVITKIIIDDIEFTFENSNTPLVWKNGNIFELEDAYEQGILNKENIEKLYSNICNK